MTRRLRDLAVVRRAAWRRGAAVRARTPALHLPPLDRVLPPRAEAIYRAIAPRVDTRVAMDIVTFMAPLWRLAGNPAYDRSIDFIAERVCAKQASLASRRDRTRTPARAGNSSAARWRSRARRARSCCRASRTASRSASTRSRRRRAASSLRLVDVGAGAAADFEGKDVKGAVVLGDAGVGPLWTRAVRERGAAGVVSTELARYTRPETHARRAAVGQHSRTTRRCDRSASRPRRARRARLREALAAGPVQRARRHRDARFIAGRTARSSRRFPAPRGADERVVLVAHVQEPGANDNASGSGTLLAAALAPAAGDRRQARCRRRARTLTFMWLDEIRGSEQWIKRGPGAGRARSSR